MTMRPILLDPKVDFFCLATYPLWVSMKFRLSNEQLGHPTRWDVGHTV